jgi:hypothetical protein
MLQLCSSLLCAACTNAGANPVTVNCDLGATTTWNAGETVQITVPVTAGLSAVSNAINTAIITDDQGRSSNDTFPVTIAVDASVSFLAAQRHTCLP